MSQWQSSQSPVVALFTRNKSNKLQKVCAEHAMKNGPNSILSRNKPLLFEVRIPHNCVNTNHGLQLSQRQNLLKCWGLPSHFYDLISWLLCLCIFLTSCRPHCSVWAKCLLSSTVVRLLNAHYIV